MSLVSDTHKFIYVSGGKVATGAIGSALNHSKGVKVYEFERKRKDWWKKYSKHMPAKFIRKYLRDSIWPKYFKFSFVRNPYDWVSSVYFYGFAKRGEGNKKLTADHIMKVVNYCQSPKGRRHDQYITIRTQKDFLSDPEGNIIVDFIGRYENLQPDFNVICNKINIPHTSLKKVNTSAASKKHYRDFYTDEAKAVVDEYFYKDIEFFGYTF